MDAAGLASYKKQTDRGVLAKMGGSLISNLAKVAIKPSEFV